MRARYYSPELRRFVNADVLLGDINNSLTLNRYAYANGNPVSNIDPFGMSADSSRGKKTNWFSDTINNIGTWFSNTFGLSILYDNTYESLSLDNVLFGAEFGASTKYEVGSGKPIEFYVMLKEGALNQIQSGYGIKLNSEKGGVKIGFSSYEISIEISYDNTSVETFIGSEKTGITISNDVSWKEYSAGSYSQYYIRPITAAMIGVISYFSSNTIFGLGVAF